MVEAKRNLEKALGTTKHKLTTYVPASELKQACHMFDQKCEMRVNEAALIEKRWPQERKRSSEPYYEHAYPKKQRGQQHCHQHCRNNSWQKKTTSTRK